MKHAEQPMDLEKQYQYSVAWSGEDEAFIGRVAEWPGLAAHGDSEDAAIDEIQSVVRFAIEDCKEQGEAFPEPFSLKEFSGRFSVRLSEELHRSLAVIAAMQDVSLNHLLVETLASVAATHRAMVRSSGPGTIPSLHSFLEMTSWPDDAKTLSVRDRKRGKTYTLASPSTDADGVLSAEIIAIHTEPQSSNSKKR